MSRSHLINANIHRAKEGARVLEDIARFILRDDKLFNQIRTIRHHIQSSHPYYDIAEDLGGVSLVEDNVRINMISIIQANALRVQEALRVLEEMETVTGAKQLMKALRYQAYDVHSNIYRAAQKYLKLNLLAGLYLIIDTDVIPHSIETIVAIINQSPVNIVQYRNKSAVKRDVFAGAYKVKSLLDPSKLLIINDHIDIALDLGDGVHIGQDDYPLERVRQIMPDDFILGISCHNLAEARIAARHDVSYIAIGCLFKTNSKSDTIPVTMQALREVRNEIRIPICAIGGIEESNLDQILTANIQLAALISHVWKTENALQTIHAMHQKIMQKQTLSLLK